MKRLTTILLIALFTANVFSLMGQEQKTVLRASNNVLSIKDGDQLRKDYWTISSDIKLDVYTANKFNKVKDVVFYSDIDSVSFALQPGKEINFMILLNNKDTCNTQIKSGITFIEPGLPEYRDTIPFKLTAQNNLAIQSVLNNKDTVNLMFHTGVNAISLTEKAAKKLSKFENSNSSVANAWGGEGEIRRFKNETFSIGDQSWEDLIIWIDKLSGHTTDGKFGPHLFENKVIEINFDDQIIVVHSALPKSLKEQGFEEFQLYFDQSSMFLEGALKIGDQIFKNKFLIHTGYGGTLLLDDAFAAKHTLETKLKIISESQLNDAFGNVLKTQKAILPQLVIGGVEYKDLPVSFFSGSIGRQKMSVIGGALLKRYNIILDLQQASLYLKANDLMALPFENG